LSVELNSSYSIDEVNVRFQNTRCFGQGSNGNFVRNTGASFEISSAAEAELQILSIQLDRILYQIEEIPTTVLLRKNSTDNFSTLITMGSLVLDTQATRTFH
jgi:hypothetical protein